MNEEWSFAERAWLAFTCAVGAVIGTAVAREWGLW